MIKVIDWLYWLVRVALSAAIRDNHEPYVGCGIRKEDSVGNKGVFLSLCDGIHLKFIITSVPRIFFMGYPNFEFIVLTSA